MMFAECGMAVYETVGRVWVEDESCERGGGSRVSSFVLRIRECTSAKSHFRIYPHNLHLNPDYMENARNSN